MTVMIQRVNAHVFRVVRDGHVCCESDRYFCAACVADVARAAASAPVVAPPDLIGRIQRARGLVEPIGPPDLIARIRERRRR